MELIVSDIEIIRAVRCLCLQHKFQDATSLAHRVEDKFSRNTLILICKSFESSQIKARVA
jgi:hypothetical protein